MQEDAGRYAKVDADDPPDMIQPQVPVDVICKVVGVSRFTRIRHYQMRSHCFELVLI